MTRVDFYILGERARDNRFSLACRITEKAWREGNRVYLHTANENECRHMDRLLWTYRDASFIPHGIVPGADAGLNPVLIGWQGEGGDEHQVLINLCPHVPDFFSRFERVIELIDNDPGVKQAGRQRYRFYKDRGYPLNDYRIEQ